MSRLPALLALAAGAALTALAAPAAAAATVEAELSVRLKPLRAEIGDHVRVDLEVVVPAGLAVGAPLFPSWGESWGETEVLAVEEPVAEPASDGATRFRQTLTLTPWATGELDLPSPVVEIPTAAEIRRLTPAKPTVLTVGSVLPEGEEQPQPKPPAAPLPLAVRPVFWWTLGAGVIACLLAAALLAWRRRAMLAAARPAVVDPLTAFRRALAGLQDGDDPRLLITALSLALRRYLGGRLDFPAAESTTTEIRRRLQERGLPASLVSGVDRLLRRCDAIKFARWPIERADCSRPLADAAVVADQLEEHLAPAAPEAEAPSRREAA